MFLASDDIKALVKAIIVCNGTLKIEQIDDVWKCKGTYHCSRVEFFLAKHIIVGRLFRNIYPSLQYSSHSRIHTSLYDFSPHMYNPHYASSPWLQWAQFSLYLSFSR